MNATKRRKHTRTRDDFRAVVGKPADPPTGRAVHDHISANVVSHQPSQQELKFLAHIKGLSLDTVAVAEVECVLRKQLNGFQLTKMRDIDVLTAAAKKYRVTLPT